MTEAEKAILLFEKQKEKIDKFPNGDDQFWRNHTLNLVEQFIGKDSSQYGLLSSHTFYPNVNAVPPETEEYQRNRGRQMIDLCIDHISAHGLKKEPLQPVINNFNNTTQSGNIYQDLSQDNSLNKQTTSIKTSKINSKHPFIEKWYWWVGTIVGLLAIIGSLKGCGIIP